MPVINVPIFRGEKPKVSPRLLSVESATKALNCSFSSGNVKAYNGPKNMSVQLNALTKTIFLLNGRDWLEWSADVDVVPSPIAQDPWGRIYFTGSGTPKVTNKNIVLGASKPNAWYTLGVPAPTQALTASVNRPNPLPPKNDRADDETRYYTYTYVTEAGEESAPGPASSAVEIKYPGSTVTISIPAMAAQTSNIRNIKIYRSATGGGVADFFLVAKISSSSSTYTDSLSSGRLLDSLTSDNYEMPHADMKHLTLMPNGILAGGWGNNVAFCESYLPHAWPSGYRLTTEHDIVAMACTGNTLVVATEGYPWIFQGIRPDSMSGRRLESMQSCVSKRSMCNIEKLIVYASPSGLVAFSGEDVQLITENVISKEEWQALEPETIEAYPYKDGYLAFYGSSLDKGFFFDPQVGDLTFFNIGFPCGFVDLKSEELFVKGAGNRLHKWEHGDPLTFSWKSKEFYELDSMYTSLLVTSPDLTKVGIKIYADGALLHNYAINTLKTLPSRLPSSRAKKWQFELYGTGEVEVVSIASTASEVMR